MSKYLLLGMVAAVLVMPALSQAADPLAGEVTISATNLAKIRGKTFTLKVNQRSWTIGAADFAKWYKVRTLADGSLRLQLRPTAIYDYLNVHVSPKVNDLGENSRYIQTAGGIQLVSGGRKGKIVDGVKTSLAIRSALVKGNTSATGTMKEYRPSIFSVEDFKRLKFPDQLTRGETNFAGSPANRRHNINVATARFNGLVIMPGEEFSFNRYLGSVDAANGYKPELVIKENTTTPEYGGGICQVSTTAFRAALQAGADVTQRRNHSYAVSYYGTPGFDATVYAPSTDFRFINDTGKPILLKTAVEGTKVIFDVWGTKDGRQVKVNGPFVTGRKPDGTQTAAVAQIVTKNGKSVREENFVSVYQPADKFPTVRTANGG